MTSPVQSDPCKDVPTLASVDRTHLFFMFYFWVLLLPSLWGEQIGALLTEFMLESCLNYERSLKKEKIYRRRFRIIITANFPATFWLLAASLWQNSLWLHELWEVHITQALYPCTYINLKITDYSLCPYQAELSSHPSLRAESRNNSRRTAGSIPPEILEPLSSHPPVQTQMRKTQRSDHRAKNKKMVER